MLTIYAVSDYTGEAAAHLVRSALLQFEGRPAVVATRGGVRTEKQVLEVVRDAAARDSVILHTIVAPVLRRTMVNECRTYGVDAIDLLGPLLDRVVAHVRTSPGEDGVELKGVDPDSARNIEAVEFTFRHDDGERADELVRADVVLVGVSRTMKTPTSLYLAYRGWATGNVPLVPDVPLHPAVERLPREKVVCLSMSYRRLLELRMSRAKQLAIPQQEYASPKVVQRELSWAQDLSTELGWNVVDVTGKSIEEVAREIEALIGGTG
jgi:regulator of PEP synthase PpsR (kinase-PPPase family)